MPQQWECVECTSVFKHCNDGLVCDSSSHTCTGCTIYEDCLYRYGPFFKCDKDAQVCVSL